MKITNFDKNQKSFSMRREIKQGGANNSLLNQYDEEPYSINDNSNFTLRTYNNSIISIRFSQQNYEKCLLLMILIILIYLTIWYLNESFSFLFSIFFYLSFSIDLMILTYYFFTVIRLRKDEIFTTMSIDLSETFDKVIILNYIIKLTNFILFFIVIIYSDFSFKFLMIIKFLLDLYFCFISLKLCMLCNFFIYLSEKIYLLWTWIKSTFCCIDEEDEPDHDIHYTKFYDLDSYSLILSSNST